MAAPTSNNSDGWERTGDGCAGLSLLRLTGFAALREALVRLPDPAAVRVVVLSAEQPWVPAEPPGAGDLLWLERFERPTLFAAAGHLAGSALDLALACDIRIGADTLTIGEPRANQRRLTTLLGGRPAPPPPVAAPEALRLGLVSTVVAAGELAAEAARMAGIIASRGPIATRLGKEAIWRGLEMPLEQALRFETDLTLLLQTTKDRAEGVEAFLKKRPPDFRGE